MAPATCIEQSVLQLYAYALLLLTSFNIGLPAVCKSRAVPPAHLLWGGMRWLAAGGATVPARHQPLVPGPAQAGHPAAAGITLLRLAGLGTRLMGVSGLAGASMPCQVSCPRAIGPTGPFHTLTCRD